MLISVFGPDGSGKSTQVTILVSYLVAEGFDVKQVWIKSYHTFSYLLFRLYEKCLPSSVVLNPDEAVIRINAVNKSSSSRLIWAWIEFVSILPCLVWRVYLSLLMGKVVIADRFLVDSIVAISYTLDQENFASTLLGRVMQCLIPRNSVLIYLDTTYGEIRARRGKRADSRDYIEFQRRLYNRLAEKLGAYEIDTTHTTIEDVANATKRLLASNLGLLQKRASSLTELGRLNSNK
jgi:thymidylate kinase